MSLKNTLSNFSLRFACQVSPVMELIWNFVLCFHTEELTNKLIINKERKNYFFEMEEVFRGGLL